MQSDRSIDAGKSFGTWPEATARLMYHDAMPALLAGVPLSGRVVDLGGGNGLLRQWIPGLVTVDNDAAKDPDILGDICTFTGDFDLGVLRYVLHYLDDNAVRDLMAHLRTYLPRLLVIQFVNDDMAAKQHNSVGEVKWFRSESQILALFVGWRCVSRKRLEYRVNAEFYRWRLNHPNPMPHEEAIVAMELVPA